ncbi:hypothetical protein D910_05276 [Dendroctonus ponderosae]|uniref:Uncharacterized protein n=1 Tax=Dendroctonus ponderosae TaxID=77166 RepID=U4U6F0_DENPD|nr:hypothetical protein D910_05276 [Dendroctonus ponderosae]
MTYLGSDYVALGGNHCLLTGAVHFDHFYPIAINHVHSAGQHGVNVALPLICALSASVDVVAYGQTLARKADGILHADHTISITLNQISAETNTQQTLGLGQFGNQKIQPQRLLQEIKNNCRKTAAFCQFRNVCDCGTMETRP